jgi:hypothetical protein
MILQIIFYHRNAGTWLYKRQGKAALQKTNKNLEKWIKCFASQDTSCYCVRTVLFKHLKNKYTCPLPCFLLMVCWLIVKCPLNTIQCKMSHFEQQLRKHVHYLIVLKLETQIKFWNVWDIFLPFRFLKWFQNALVILVPHQRQQCRENSVISPLTHIF